MWASRSFVQPFFLQRFAYRWLSVLLMLMSTSILAQSPTSQNSDTALVQLRYNHPGLVVDLGVGLWAWPIPCDADGDGDYDLIVSCPDKPSNGVWLFENRQGDTRENPMPVFEPAVRLSGTVHYVMPSYTERGMKVLSPGKEYTNFTKSGIQESKTLSVAANFYKPQGGQTKGPKVRHNQWRYVDYDHDGTEDLIVGVEDWSFYGWDDAWDAQGRWVAGPLRGFVYWLKGLGDGKFAEPVSLKDTLGNPLETFGCPSPNLLDWDHDGDLDLLCGEFLDGFTYFQNTGSKDQVSYQSGVRVLDTTDRPLKMDLQMIVPVAFDWDRDGHADLIVGDEDGRVAFLKNCGTLGEDRVPKFEAPRYFEQKADTLKCGALATPVGVDWDDDGDQDIVSGNTAGYIEFFENLSGPGVTAPKWDRPKRLAVDGKVFRVMAGPNGSIQGPAEAKWGYTTLSVADWDHDGLKDIILSSILGRVVWLKNIGAKGSPILAEPRAIPVEWEQKQPELPWGWLKPLGDELLTQWRTTPVVYDFNRDGLVDLAMLDTQGYLVYFERVRRQGELFLKSPRRSFLDNQGNPLRLNPKSAGGSGRRKIAVCDWNSDGAFDLLLNSKNADLMLQENPSASDRPVVWRFDNSGSLADKNIEGHDVSPTTIDLDGDGKPEFLGGAEDGRMYYLSRLRQNASAKESTKVDAIYYNGKVVTVDGKGQVAQAFATANDRIVAVGTDTMVRKLAAADTKEQDLQGRMVLPGLIDSHVHAPDAAMYEWDHPIPEMETIEDVLAYVRSRAQVLEPGRWIVVSQVFVTRLVDPRFPTRYELDKVAPDHPVFFRTGPDGALNSLALRRTGIDKDFKITDGQPGYIETDPSTGEPNGILRSCTRLVSLDEPRSKPSQQERVARLELLLRDYNSVGLTSICDRLATDDGIGLYESLLERNALTCRVFLSYSVNAQSSMEEIDKSIRKAASHPRHRYDNRLWLRGVKVFLDGGMLTGSAYMRKPWGVSRIYSITDEQYRGLLYIEASKLYEMSKIALKNDLQFTAHSVGDGAVEALIDAYERIAKEDFPVRDKRPCITHCNFMSAEAIERMSKLGIVADLQPAWLLLDGKTLLTQFGQDRTEFFQPYRTLADSGVIVGGGSDHMQKIGSFRSVNPYNPFLGMSVAVQRIPRGLDEPLHPEQSITRQEAIRLYTLNNAYLTFEEDQKGSIEAGKLADFIIIDRDILGCPLEQIASTKVLETYVGGKQVYKSQ